MACVLPQQNDAVVGMYHLALEAGKVEIHKNMMGMSILRY